MAESQSKPKTKTRNRVGIATGVALLAALLSAALGVEGPGRLFWAAVAGILAWQLLG